jgi:hypothetical protein
MMTKHKNIGRLFLLIPGHVINTASIQLPNYQLFGETPNLVRPKMIHMV